MLAAQTIMVWIVVVTVQLDDTEIQTLPDSGDYSDTWRANNNANVAIRSHCSENETGRG